MNTILGKILNFNFSKIDVFTQLMQGTDEELANGPPIYTFKRNVYMPLDTLLDSIGAPCYIKLQYLVNF